MSTTQFLGIRKDRLVRPKAKATKLGAVGYYRVSTKEQLQNLSIDTQRYACAEYCERNGFRLVAEFQESASAKTTERPEFQSMLEFCRKNEGGLGAVVVYSITRFSRNAADHLAVRASLKLLNIQLHSATEQLGDGSSGFLVEGMLGLMAQWDNEVRSERTTAGMTTAARHGQWCHKAPLGYLNDRDSPSGLRVDPTRVEMVKKAFELFDSGFTKAEVLAKVRTAGLTMPKSGRPISAQTLDKLLRNPLYCGWITSNGWDIEVRGDFAPIVDEQRFRRIAERLSGGLGERQVRSKHSVDFPLRVFLRCAVCGVPLTGSSTTGGRGKRYAYYSCRTAGCKTASFRRDVLHRMFVEFLYQLFPREALMDRFQAVVKGVWLKRHAERERERDLAIERKARLEARRQRLIELLVDRTLQKPDYENQMMQVGTEMLEIERQIDSKLIAEADLERLLEFSEWLLERVPGIWSAAELTNKLRLQQALFPNGLTVSADGFGTAQHPFFFKSSTLLIHAPDELASPGGFEPPLPP